MAPRPDIQPFEESLHGMVLADDDRRLRQVNHAACVMVQRPREVVLRLRIDDFTAPVGQPAIEPAWRQMLEQGSLTGTWPLITGDQRLVPMEYSAVARARGAMHLIVFAAQRVPQMAFEDPPEGAAGLTEREREVLQLLALGYTGPEIADRLVLGLDTVRTHIRNLKRKLGARTLPHLVALGLSHQK